MKRFQLTFILLFMLCAAVGKAGDIKVIEWDTLIPELPPQENQLKGLTEEEVGFIEWLIYLKTSLPEEESAETKELRDELKKALPILKEKGINIDTIIADRQYRSTAVNKNLHGQQVRLAGYLLPLDLSGKAVSDFLLVPYFGACIHTPPPPPNQIVHAVSSQPIPYDMETMYKPVSVIGVIKAQSLEKELFLADGSDNIDIGYSISVEKILEYKE